MYRSCSKRETTTDFQNIFTYYCNFISHYRCQFTEGYTLINALGMFTQTLQFTKWQNDPRQNANHVVSNTDVHPPLHHLSSWGIKSAAPLRNILNKRTFSVYTTCCFFWICCYMSNWTLGGRWYTSTSTPPIITAIYIYIFGDGWDMVMVVTLHSYPHPRQFPFHPH